MKRMLETRSKRSRSQFGNEHLEAKLGFSSGTATKRALELNNVQAARGFPLGPVCALGIHQYVLCVQVQFRNPYTCYVR